jgi:hypothetical protein
MAREIKYPVGELLALGGLSMAASHAGDHDDAVRLPRQAGQVTAGVPPTLARVYNQAWTFVLIAAGDLAAAAQVSAAGLDQAREASDLWNQSALLPRIADLDLRAGRTGDATAHLREGLQLAVRTGNGRDLLAGLEACGTLCAATRRYAEALTVWAAYDALRRHEGGTEPAWAVLLWEDRRREARQVLGPDLARAAEDRGAAMRWATAAEYARRPPLHQRSHGQLPSGPDPGQDRLPPPRRPDPPGPGRGPGLSSANAAQVSSPRSMGTNGLDG